MARWVNKFCALYEGAPFRIPCLAENELSLKRIIIDVSINHDKPTVIPAKAGIQQDKNVFCLNPLDSRLRGNDVVILYIPQLILKGEELSSIMESSISVTC